MIRIDDYKQYCITSIAVFHLQKEVKNNICVVSLHLTGLDTSNGEVKGKGTHEPKAQMGGAYPCFISMKHT